MKKTLIILIFLAASTALLASEFTRHVELEKKIQGDWLAAEYYVAEPSPELQQSIKSMTFLANKIVEWKYVHDGKAYKAKGYYGIYSFPTDEKTARQLPSLIVAPTKYANPLVSSHLLLTLSEVELDFDSRFLQRWGKLIKAKGPGGKRVLFIRKDNKISSERTTERDK
jgi:hypothetical protein